MNYYDFKEPRREAEAAFAFKVFMWLLVMFIAFEIGLQIGIHQGLEDGKRMERASHEGVTVGYRGAE